MRRTVVALAAACLLLGACANEKGQGSKNVKGKLTVLAAASLTEAFDGTGKALESSHHGLKVTFSFGGSGALVTQIQQGAPADVVATADEATMAKLVTTGLVDTPNRFAGNKLEILVAPGNPKGIHTVADLARPDIVFVTEEDAVPAGKYTAQMLAKASVSANPKSKELDVKAAVAKVVVGEADATVVYVTDVLAVGNKAQGVPIPETLNVPAVYVIAKLKSAGNPLAADAFIESVARGAGHAVLRRHGFTDPT
jgi:molybdate transport system substrate-binding protein